MKIKFTLTQFINFLMGLAIILIILYLAFPLFIRNNVTTTQVDTVTFNTIGIKLKPIDYTPPGYDHYKQLVENYKYYRQLKNGASTEGGFSFGWFLGVKEAVYCDTCTMDKNGSHYPFSAYQEKQLTKYYLELPGWKLKGDIYDAAFAHPEFHVEHGQSYIRKTVVRKRPNNPDVVDEIDVPVKFKYDTQFNTALIPSTYSSFHIVSIALHIFIVLYFAYYLYVIAVFLKFVIDISRGLIFTSTNLSRLKFIAFSLLGLSVMQICLTFLVRLIFNSYFTSDLEVKSEVWGTLWPTLPMGIVFLLLFKAFKQGKTLKEESDLTV